MAEENFGIKIGKKAFLSSFFILLGLIIFAGILTLVVPTGSYERQIVNGSEVFNWESFSFTQEGKLPFYRWFTAPLEVLVTSDGVKALALIVLLLIIGGSFAVIDKANVLKSIVSSIVKKFRNRRYFLIAIITFIFMGFGSVLGIFEEAVPLVPIIIALSYLMGWDALVGLGMSLLAITFGFSSAISNPFTIGLAQKLTNLPAFSGTWYRLIIFAVIYTILFFFLVRYAKKIDKDAKKSLVYEEDLVERRRYSSADGFINDNFKDKKTVNAVRCFLLMIFLMLFVIVLGIFIPEVSDIALILMALLYLIAGICTGLFAGMGVLNTFKVFAKGMAGISASAVLILMGISVKHIIVSGNIMDTLLYYAAQPLSGASPYSAVIIIYMIVLCSNFFIGSASAKAFLLIPLLVPFAQMVGLSNQVMITAWAFGDGFSNALYPTNPVLLICLGLSTVSYPKWFRWTFLLQLIVFMLTIGFSLFAVFINYV